MAITIDTPPTQISIIPGQYTTLMPVYNTIEWIVSSDNSNECNFKFICDIYIENNGIGFVKRLKAYPDENNQGSFKINSVLKDYIVNNPMISIQGFDLNQNKCLEYYLSFGEEYDNSIDCDQPVTSYPDLLETDLQYAWNAALQYRENRIYLNTSAITQYIMNPIVPGKFLTHSPERILIGIGEEAELSFLNMPGIGNYGGRLKIETFDHSNNPQNQINIINGNYVVTQWDKIYNQIGVGPYNINNFYGDTFINSDTKYYRVSLLSVDSAQLLNNPTLKYLGGPGTNSWNTDSYPGCSTSFGITVADKMQFIMPDSSCGQTLTVSYQDTTFIEGLSYSVSFTVDSLNNPSGKPQSVTVNMAGNNGTPRTGTGTFTETIVAANTGNLELIGYFDADTAGFGSHSFSISNITVTLLGGNRTSEYKYYEIDRRKSRYKPMRFRWLNLLGGYDSYSFNQAKSNQLTITRTEYQKLLNTNYQMGDRGRTLTSVKATEKVIATSNWLTEKESEWLNELYTSLDVYKQDTCPLFPFHSISALSVNTVFYFNCPLTQEEQDFFNINSKILIDKCNKTLNPDLDGYHADGGDMLDASRYRLFYTVSSPPPASDCGIIYYPGLTLFQEPIIITSNNFDYKVKARTKNINQIVEFEYAFDKNIQRN